MTAVRNTVMEKSKSKLNYDIVLIYELTEFKIYQFKVFSKINQINQRLTKVQLKKYIKWVIDTIVKDLDKNR